MLRNVLGGMYPIERMLEYGAVPGIWLESVGASWCERIVIRVLRRGGIDVSNVRMCLWGYIQRLPGPKSGGVEGSAP